MTTLARDGDLAMAARPYGAEVLTDAEIDAVSGGERSLVEVVGAVINAIFGGSGGSGGAGGAGGSGGSGGSCTCPCGPTIQIHL